MNPATALWRDGHRDGNTDVSFLSFLLSTLLWDTIMSLLNLCCFWRFFFVFPFFRSAFSEIIRSFVRDGPATQYANFFEM